MCVNYRQALAALDSQIKASEERERQIRYLRDPLELSRTQAILDIIRTEHLLAKKPWRYLPHDGTKTTFYLQCVGDWGDFPEVRELLKPSYHDTNRHYEEIGTMTTASSIIRGGKVQEHPIAGFFHRWLHGRKPSVILAFYWIHYDSGLFLALQHDLGRFDAAPVRKVRRPTTTYIDWTTKHITMGAKV